MGHITAEIKYSDLSGNPDPRHQGAQYYADLTVTSSVELPVSTVAEIGLSTLARHNPRVGDRFKLAGLMPRRYVSEQPRSWPAGWHIYHVTMRDLGDPS